MRLYSCGVVLDYERKRKGWPKEKEEEEGRATFGLVLLLLPRREISFQVKESAERPLIGRSIILGFPAAIRQKRDSFRSLSLSLRLPHTLPSVCLPACLSICIRHTHTFLYGTTSLQLLLLQLKLLLLLLLLLLLVQ